MEKANVFQISTEPATSNTASSSPSTLSPTSATSDVQEVEDTSDFFMSSDDELNENAPENRSPTNEEDSEEESVEEESEEDEESENEEPSEAETKNINAIANLVGSAATDSGFARKLYKGLCVMKELIDSLEARGVVFEAQENEEEEEEEDENEEEEEEEETSSTPLFENAPAVEKVSPLPNAESMLGTNIPLSEEKPTNTNESLTPPSATATTPDESKSLLNSLTGILTGKTPLFSKTRRNKHRRAAAGTA